MIQSFAHTVVCAWCGWSAVRGSFMKDGRAVCVTCIREETQD